MYSLLGGGVGAGVGGGFVGVGPSNYNNSFHDYQVFIRRRCGLVVRTLAL